MKDVGPLPKGAGGGTITLREFLEWRIAQTARMERELTEAIDMLVTGNFPERDDGESLH